MMLDSSHHHGDFLSPPGGQSPDSRAAAHARPVPETLEGAANAVGRESLATPGAHGSPAGERPLRGHALGGFHTAFRERPFHTPSVAPCRPGRLYSSRCQVVEPHSPSQA